MVQNFLIHSRGKPTYTLTHNICSACDFMGNKCDFTYFGTFCTNIKKI